MKPILFALLLTCLVGCASHPDAPPAASEPLHYYTDEAGRIYEVRGDIYELIFVPPVSNPDRWSL